MNCSENSSWLTVIINSALIPFLVSAVSFVSFRAIDERKKRIIFSTLGTIIIDSLIEEVSGGYGIMNSAVNASPPNAPLLVPSKSWEGLKTFPDEVMLRIISVSKKAKPIGKFYPKDIRMHAKNYFEYMVSNWNNAVNERYAPQVFPTTFKIYPESAKGVLDMLVQIKQLLEDNSKSWFPK
jgi:hypothetical protein